LIFIDSWDVMAPAAACLVGFTAAHHDRWGFVDRWFPVDQPLIATRFFTADDANGMKLLNVLCDSHQLWHGSERLPSEIRIRAGQDHPHSAIGEVSCYAHNPLVEELRLVYRDDFGVWPDQLHYLSGRIHGLGFDGNTVMGRDRVKSGVPIVEVRLEDLDSFLGYDGSAYAADQFLAFAAEHHAGYNLDLSGFRPWFHSALPFGRDGRSGYRHGTRESRRLRLRVRATTCLSLEARLQVSDPGVVKLFQWRLGGTVNKTELQEALASAADLSKADAARALDALFGPDGIVGSELRRGGKVQITGFGSFVVRDRAARTGRDPRTGAALQIAAAKVPAFKAGQALKDAVNK
jgi:DNA-binding protein HU-beta